MPVKVRRFSTSVLLNLTALGVFASAQTQPQTPPADAQPTQTPQAQTVPIKAPTSAEIMRDRIAKAKAFIAVRNYNAAIYELENIRRETSDASVQAVTTVLLMNSYLEQGDYKRAQDFLTEAYNAQKTNKPGSADIYNAVAGQIVKGARTKVERYKALGLMVGDRNLPLEAVNDVERMRETVELVITQAKENGKDKTKSSTAMAMLEEATTSRSALARDDYDARRWKDEVADSREQLANSRSVIINAVDGTASPNTALPPPQTVAMNTSAPMQAPPQTMMSMPKPVEPAPATMQPKTEVGLKPSETLKASNDKPIVPEPKPSSEKAPPVTDRQAAQETTKNSSEPVKTLTIMNPSPDGANPVKSGPAAETAKESGPMEVGSLLAYATKQSPAVYPPAAKSMRTTGVVKVEVTVDENGQVAEVQNASGPSLLQGAAKDAIRKWRFKPFTRDGQPVRAVGFVSFNFSL